MSESSLEIRRRTRRLSQCIVGFQYLKGVQMFRGAARESSEIDCIFPCHGRQIEYGTDVSLNNHALVIISLPEN